jgi:hypothetical protein
MHLKLTNGVPETYSIGQLRRDNPQTSFTKLISDETLADYGVYPYTRPDRPAYDGLTSKVVDGSFEQDAVGNWTLPYVVEQLPLDQQIENLKVARGHAYTEEADPLFFKSQRGEILLTEWEAKVDEIRTRYPYPEGSI